MGVRNCEKMLKEYLELSDKLVNRLVEDEHESLELMFFSRATDAMHARILERSASYTHLKEVVEDLSSMIRWVAANPIKAFAGFVGATVITGLAFFMTHFIVELIMIRLLGGIYGG